MNLRLQAEEVKKRIAKGLKYGDSCFVCGCKISRRGMVIHHLFYIFNDVVYSNYPKNDSGKLQYYLDLEPLAKEMPERFLYLCNPHHQALERINRYSDKTLKRLLKARKLTKTGKKE